MTLIITMIRPEGIWQSADFRTTIGKRIVDNDAPKQLNIACPPYPGGPSILLGFTGLAVLHDGTPTLRWIRETVRGQPRPIMQLFAHLNDRLTRDVGGSPLWGTPLILCGGIFEGSKRFYFEIRNIDSQSRKPRRRFDYALVEIQRSAVFLAGGGADAVSASDLELLRTQVEIRPNNWEDHLGLLAGVNRRAAPHSKNGVSAWCQATFLSSESKGAQSRAFAKHGEPEIIAGAEQVFAGLDFTDTTRLLMRHVQEMTADPDKPMPDFTESLRKMTEGRN